MLIRRAESMPGTPMKMDGAQDVSMRLMVGRSDGAPNFSMRHFTVDPGRPRSLVLPLGLGAVD